MTKPKPTGGNPALKGADLGAPPILPPRPVGTLRQLAIATDRIAQSLDTIAQAVTDAVAEDQAAGHASSEQRERRARAEDARAARERIHWDTVMRAGTGAAARYVWEATGDPLTGPELTALDLDGLWADPSSVSREELVSHMDGLRRARTDPYGRPYGRR